MKLKLTLLISMLSGTAFADRLGSLPSGADVLLTTQAVAGSFSINASSAAALSTKATLASDRNLLYTQSGTTITLSVTPQGDGVLPSTYSYAYRKTFTIDFTKVSNTDQANFPVVFSMTDPNLATSASGGHVTNASGYDIVFSTMPDCSYLLSWDTETYTASTGNLIAWVKVPTVSASVNTAVYMCYGNSSITTYQGSASSVWSNNYEGVFHLGSAGVTVESSTHALTATNTGVTSTTGQIGTGGGFASGQFMTSGGNSDYLLTSSGTTSGWIKTTANSTYNPMMGKANFGTDRNGYLMTVNTTINKIFEDMCSASAAQQVTGTASVSQSVWHYIVATWNGATINFFIDGVLDNHQTQTVTPVNTATTLHIGSDASQVFTSTSSMDELHLSLTARTTDWILTEYRNQNSPSTFYSVSAESSIYGGKIALINATNGWAAPQTFSSATTTSGPLIVSSNVVLNSTWGTTGQVFTSSAGAAPYWATVTTATARQIAYAGGPSNALTGNPYLTFFSSMNVGSLGTENIIHRGVSPFYVQASTNAMGLEFFDAYEQYANKNMWGAIVEHPNAFPGISIGLMNIYQRDGGHIFVDMTGQSTNNTGTFQVRVADAQNEGTPWMSLQTNATSQTLISDIHKNCSATSPQTQFCFTEPSAVLEATSTTRGFLPPRMTTTQKNAISAPAAGLIVYDVTLATMTFYNGSAWVTMGGAAGPAGSSGASTLAIATGTSTGFSAPGSSPTAVVNLDQSQFSASLQGSATSFVTIAYSTAVITGNITLTSTHSVVMVDASGGARTITLPTAVGISGRIYRIKMISASSQTNTVTVGTTSSQTIDGAATQVLYLQYTDMPVISDGSNWSIL